MNKLDACNDQLVIQARVISKVQLSNLAPIIAINRQIISVATALFDVEVAITSHQTYHREECLRKILQVERHSCAKENERVPAVI